MIGKFETNTEKSTGRRPLGRLMISIMLTISLIMGSGFVAFGADDSAAYIYENPRDIIIKAPSSLNFTTTSAKYSIYGASDPDYPLTMNGNPVERTEQGFFALYLPLSTGKNTFKFENNGKEKTVVLTRKGSSSGGGSSSSGGESGGSSSSSSSSGQGTAPVVWSALSKATYGTVSGNNISRMAAPGYDNKQLLPPLAKGTVVQFTGESGSTYRLSDGTFAYKSNFTVTAGTLPKTDVFRADFIPITPEGCTEIQLIMNQNTFYNLTMESSRAVLTLHNINSIGTVRGLIEAGIVTENPMLKSIEYVSSTEKSLTYTLNFYDGVVVNGYYVYFDGGVMKIGFKPVPALNGTDLSGLRIHIDAGHGGSDSGATGALGVFGPMEKHINLRIAIFAKAYLESRGATVIMTREDDSSVGLATRAYQVAVSKPDFCLSIHCNSIDPVVDYTRVSGLQTYYSFNNAKAAGYINDVVAGQMGVSKIAPVHRNLAMTRMTECPAVLVECAFMSNPKEYQWLIQKEVQEQLGMAAGKAVEAYWMQQIPSTPQIPVIPQIPVTPTSSAFQLPDKPLPSGEIRVLVNGNSLIMEQPPVIQNNRTLVPLRAIFEALSADVFWDEPTQKVTAIKENTQITLIIGQSIMDVTDSGVHRTIALEAPAQIMKDRTMIPLRAVAESLGAKVDWIEAIRTVTVEK